jgi:hypothetical protein
MIWVDHVAFMVRIEMYTKFWSENLKGRNHSEDLGVDGRTILQCTLKKQGEEVWPGFIWLRTETVDRHL